MFIKYQYLFISVQKCSLSAHCCSFPIISRKTCFISFKSSKRAQCIAPLRSRDGADPTPVPSRRREVTARLGRRREVTARLPHCMEKGARKDSQDLAKVPSPPASLRAQWGRGFRGGVSSYKESKAKESLRLSPVKNEAVCQISVSQPQTT